MLDVKALINKLLEAVSVDYIVEEGTDSNNWTYRKWNSGKCELWYSSTVTLTINWVTGNVYQTSAYTTLSYPFTLTDVTFGTVIPSTTSYGVWSFVDEISTASIKYHVMASLSRTSKAYNICAYIVGKWK